MSPAWLNPDCLGGKHAACAGDAWDFDTDQPARCTCTCHGPRTLRAITVRQPWAWAVVYGGKDVENRSRNIAGSFRGPVAIHAGLAKYEQDNMSSRAHRDAHGGEVDTAIVYGAIIGVVDLVDVHQGHLHSGECSVWSQPGAVHLLLRNPRPLTRPIPYKGALGLWTLPDDVLDGAL